jgi:hypothetical protein
MKTKDTTLQFVIQNGDIMLISPLELSVDELKQYHWYSERTCSVKTVQQSVPVVPGKIEMWESSGGHAPHIRYECPICKQSVNTDLYENDPNPRFAWCDLCQWDSVMWIRWER